jgi:DNA-binding NarL/FixJ family response regulator
MSSKHPPSPAKATVFIVDDHPMVRDWLSRLINDEEDLEVCGFADNAGEARQAISQLRPAISIIDIGLRGKSGLELIRALTDQNPDQNILVLSMHDEDVYAYRAFRAGARGYVNKRQTADEVVLALRRILAGGVYVNEAFAATLTMGLTRHRNVDKADADTMTLLSDRELEVFRLLAAGRKNSEIATDLSVSLKTVQSYCARIKEKLNLSNATELLQAATRWADEQNKG